MGTQAVVSVTEHGKTRLKVVCGHNGYNAHKLASWLKTNFLTSTALDIFQYAQSISFGCDCCLVVVTPTSHLYSDKLEDAVYRSTFDNPTFNPRWEIGEADYIEIVELIAPVSYELTSTERGLNFYDVKHHPKGVRRVVVGHGIQNGEEFSVYSGQSYKSSGTWTGSLDSSMLAWQTDN